MENNETTVLILILCAFPILFGGIWCGVCQLLSFVGGWGRLAKRFPATNPPANPLIGCQNGMVGGVNYKTSLTLGCEPEGLYVSVMVFFRIGHPTLLIPWDEIRNVRPGKFLWGEWITFDVGSPKITTMRIGKSSVTEEIVAKIGSNES